MEDENGVADNALPRPSLKSTVGNSKLPSPVRAQHVRSTVLKYLSEPPASQPQSSQSSRVSGSKFREVNEQRSSDYRKRDKAERRHDAELTSLEAAENGQSLYARQEPAECSCEGTESTLTTSSDSDASLTSIATNGEEVRTMTDTSYSSEGREKSQRKGKDSMGSGEDSRVTGNEESVDITEAWKAFEKSWKGQVLVTEEEKQNGFRFSREIDPKYLGFKPRKRDKREYLKAYPIVGPLPDGQLFCNCSFPMTCGQWSFIVGFVVFFAAIGTGVYFYLSSQTLEF